MDILVVLLLSLEDISSISVYDSSFQISNSIALDSRNIVTRNNVTSYFRSAANRNVVSCSGRHFSITVQPILTKSTVLETAIQVLHCFCFTLPDVFSPWLRKWGSNGPTVAYALCKWRILIFAESTHAGSSKMTSLDLSGRQQIA